MQKTNRNTLAVIQELERGWQALRLKGKDRERALFLHPNTIRQKLVSQEEENER